MKKNQVFDPPMCCNTDVCGVSVNQTPVTFAADVDWAKRKGADIERYSLAQQPQMFADSEAVRNFLQRSGQDALPLVLIDGEVVLAGLYPKRTELELWTGIQPVDTTEPNAVVPLLKAEPVGVQRLLALTNPQVKDNQSC